MNVDLFERDTLCELTDCTIKMLEILISNYQAGKISIDDFKINTAIKIIFLKSNIDKLKLATQKKLVLEVLKDYELILSSPKF